MVDEFFTIFWMATTFSVILKQKEYAPEQEKYILSNH